ncbi:ArsR family transcriptional regulator [Kribbella sp. NPDC050281]|uniref:ArsR family transcriptional regulator n=1 Tax=Kribbella sp. NPDC050281 TaxID=3155515 RepID=UPI00340166BE
MAVDNRLAELERRIAALESAADGRGGARRRTSAGQAEATRALSELRAWSDWSDVAPTLAALGNSVRLTLLREIVRGRATVSALSQVDGLGTSGQIYHHLRHLTAEGWLHTPTRGTFAIPPHRVTALQAILAALEADQTA